MRGSLFVISFLSVTASVNAFVLHQADYIRSPICLHCSGQEGNDAESKISNSRRLFLTSTSCGVALSFLAAPEANAAKGAAELDFEFYVRDLVFGNKPEGNLPASTAPNTPPPRTLRQPLLNLLIDDDLQSCIPVQELARISGASVTEVSERVMQIRSKVQPAFRSRYQWIDDSVADEYFFDCTVYSLWKVAALYISEDYSKRDTYVRNIGRRLLNEIIQKGILSKESISILSKEKEKDGSRITQTIPCVIEVLNLFQESQFCSSFRIGDKNDETRSGAQVFDELDDQELLDGGSVNCLISILNPATLGGALQITGEGSRFAPDFIGPTIAAVWEKVLSGGKGNRIAVEWESYFVDPVYRPNPKDFFPNERLYQFTVANKKG